MVPPRTYSCFLACLGIISLCFWVCSVCASTVPPCPVPPPHPPLSSKCLCCGEAGADGFAVEPRTRQQQAVHDDVMAYVLLMPGGSRGSRAVFDLEHMTLSVHVAVRRFTTTLTLGEGASIWPVQACNPNPNPSPTTTRTLLHTCTRTQTPQHASQQTHTPSQPRESQTIACTIPAFISGRIPATPPSPPSAHGHACTHTILRRLLLLLRVSFCSIHRCSQSLAATVSSPGLRLQEVPDTCFSLVYRCWGSRIDSESELLRKYFLPESGIDYVYNFSRD